jgi:H+/gluconate symporter-like permease
LKRSRRISAKPGLNSIVNQRNEEQQEEKSLWNKLMNISNLSKLLLISFIILSFKSTIDYIGLTPYIMAFFLGAIWMLTTLAILIVIYFYFNFNRDGFRYMMMIDKLFLLLQSILLLLFPSLYFVL